MVQVDAAQQEEKYLFIWDQTDQIDTFFKYKGALCDFFFWQMKHEGDRGTADEGIDQLRQEFIKAGR